MKILLLTLVVFSVASIQATSPLEERHSLLTKKHLNYCLGKSGVDVNFLEKARGGEYADDSKFKAHVLCVSKQIGFQDADGQLQSDVLKAKILDVLKDEALVDKLIGACIYKSDNPEDVAVHSFKCFHQKAGVILL